MLGDVRCSLFVVGRVSLFVVRCPLLLFVVCCSLFVLLFEVVRCVSLFVVYCAFYMVIV